MLRQILAVYSNYVRDHRSIAYRCIPPDIVPTAATTAAMDKTSTLCICWTSAARTSGNPPSRQVGEYKHPNPILQYGCSTLSGVGQRDCCKISGKAGAFWSAPHGGLRSRLSPYMISPPLSLLITVVELLIVRNLNYTGVAYRGRRGHIMGAKLVVEGDPLTAVIE